MFGLSISRYIPILGMPGSLYAFLMVMAGCMLHRVR